MKICLWQRPNDINGAGLVFSAMAEGIRASGHEVEYIDPMAQPITPRLTQGHDAHVVYTYQYQRSDQIVEACRFDRPNRRITPHPVIVIDSAWMQRDQHQAIGLGGINGDAEFKNADSPVDRFEALGIEIKPWRTGGDYILIASNAKSDINLPCDRITWAEKVIAEIRTMCSLPIVYRPFPTDKRNRGIEGTTLSFGRSLEDDLSGAAVVVTHTSNVVIDALLEGIPVFTTGKSVADSIVFQGVGHIGDVVTGGMTDRGEAREQFFYDLAYAQWTLDEMREGVPFRRLMGIEKARKSKGKKRTESNIDDSIADGSLAYVQWTIDNMRNGKRKGKKRHESNIDDSIADGGDTQRDTAPALL